MHTTKSSLMTKFNVLFVVCFISLLSACTWVKKTPEAASVRIVPSDRVADCTRIGDVTTNTVDKLSVINRNAQKVETELETLAQNQAAISNADTIVPLGEVEDGRRTFTMYKCL